MIKDERMKRMGTRGQLHKNHIKVCDSPAKQLVGFWL